MFLTANISVVKAEEGMNMPQMAMNLKAPLKNISNTDEDDHSDNSD